MMIMIIIFIRVIMIIIMIIITIKIDAGKPHQKVGESVPHAEQSLLL